MKKNYLMMSLVFLTFFVISLITNILGPIIPDISNSFRLSYTLVALLPFSFFIAYGIMSIPAGFFIEVYYEKKTMLLSFLIILISAFMFALVSTYWIAIISLFLIGIGMAMLQVVINPLLRVSGGEEHFAFNSVMAQLIFGLASFLSPRIYSSLVQNLGKNMNDMSAMYRILKGLVPDGLDWISLYWIFGLVALLMLIIISFLEFPKVERTEDESAGAWATYGQLFRNPIVILFFLGIFCYVGTEQGVANWMSTFLQKYHGYDPQLIGSRAVSWFWGAMTAGCLLGLVLLKLFDSRKVLIASSLFSMMTLAVALFGPASISLRTFPLIGFFISVMWSIIFSLALNSLARHHGCFSGILCTGIAGGALVSFIIGFLADQFGLRTGMMFLFLTMGYILSIGFWAKPLITNKTIELRKKKRVAAEQDVI